MGEISSLELMRRIARRLPSNGREAVTLQQVMQGLAVGDLFMAVDSQIAHRSDNAETARQLLAELLPRLQGVLPNDADVQELVGRYGESS